MNKPTYKDRDADYWESKAEEYAEEEKACYAVINETENYELRMLNASKMAQAAYNRGQCEGIVYGLRWREQQQEAEK